jgi:hypothetical protein
MKRTNYSRAEYPKTKIPPPTETSTIGADEIVNDA